MSLFPKVGRKQPALRVSWWAVVVFLCIGVLLHLFPFYYMVILSFTSPVEAMSSTPVLFPKEPTTAAWELVFTIVTRDMLREFQLYSAVLGILEQPLYTYFFNSLIYTFGVLIFSLPVTAFAAYANTKLMRGPAKRWTFLFFISTMMIPGVVTLIPSFLLTRTFPFPLPVAPNIPGTETPFPTLRIWDTGWSVILPAVFNAFNFLMFKGFFDTIPDSIIQAARVDGGSEFNIFRKIVLPMSVPVFAVAAWTQFGGVWESYLWPMLTIQTSKKQMMGVAIATLVRAFVNSNATNAEAAANIAMNPQLRKMLEAGISWNGLMVLGLLQTIPIFIMFIICREYLMKGIRVRGFR